MIFVSSRRDLISKVMFSLRDIMLSKTELSWHCFFITCLPCVLLDNLNAPFPTMIGIQRDLFEGCVEEMCNLYLEALETPFEVPAPCIVDIDAGEILEIEMYKAMN
jgi:hypothetical protein